MALFSRGWVVFVDSTLLTGKAKSTSTPTMRTRWFTGYQGRRIREALLAYAFLFPAFLMVGLFGLFPLLFAGFESTRRGLNNIIGPYDGLGNFVRAIGDLTYLLFFWVAALLIYLALRGVVESVKLARERGESAWRWALSGGIVGAGLLGLIFSIFHTLPLLLVVPSQLRGRENTPESFRRLIGEVITTRQAGPHPSRARLCP